MSIKLPRVMLACHRAPLHVRRGDGFKELPLEARYDEVKIISTLPWKTIPEGISWGARTFIYTGDEIVRDGEKLPVYVEVVLVLAISPFEAN